MTNARCCGIAIVACVLAASTSPALARPHKVLVLPLEGTADPVTRAKLTASVQRLARVIDGEVLPGDTTFAETATAVGCDPGQATCVDTVRTTLGVDELVYGSANLERGRVVIVVRRAARGVAPREITTVIGAKDPPGGAEPALLPVFNEADEQPGDTVTVAPTGVDPAGDTLADAPAAREDMVDPTRPPPASGTPVEDDPAARAERTDRALKITAVAGGGTMVLIGLILWSSASGIQDDIDRHPVERFEDFQNLRALEDKASTRAVAGDLMVLGGLALGGYGGYLLWQDHKARVSVAPMPVAGGAGVTFTLGGAR